MSVQFDRMLQPNNGVDLQSPPRMLSFRRILEVCPGEPALP